MDVDLFIEFLTACSEVNALQKVDAKGKDLADFGLSPCQAWVLVTYTDGEELSLELKQMGYKLQCNPIRKYWTITLPGWEKPIRIHKLGDNYGKDRIIERLYENDSSIRQDKFLSAYNKRGSRYKLPTRADKIRKKSGFQRRYLRCLYELGYLPKYKQSPAEVHSIFKDELMKCDMYSREARLLCDNNIVTEQDLFRYEKSIEGRMFSLTAVRAEL